MTDTAGPIMAAPVGGVAIADVTNVQATATAPLQALVDTADTASASLRAQRDALVAQRTALDAQINTLNAQISTVEGPGAQIARNAIVAIQNAMRPQPQPSPQGGPAMAARARMEAMRAAALAKTG